MTRVLVVEDDPAIAEALSVQLGKAGYDVLAAGSGPAGWQALVRERPDALLLDLSLPGMDGQELLRRLRKSGSELAVLAVTADGSTASLVRVLELGADDYIVKPFRAAELIARLRAALRRSALEVDHPPAGPHTLACGELTIDVDARVARLAGTPLELSRTEFRLLEVLLQRPGKIVPAEEVAARVWGSATDLDPSTPRVNLYRLRHKLDAARPGWGVIRSVRGIGWGLFPASGGSGRDTR